MQSAPTIQVQKELDAPKDQLKDQKVIHDSKAKEDEFHDASDEEFDDEYYDGADDEPDDQTAKDYKPTQVETKTDTKTEPKTEAKQSADEAAVEPANTKVEAPKLPSNKFSVPELYVDEEDEDDGPVDMDLDEWYEAEEVEPNVFSSQTEQLENYANHNGHQNYHQHHNAVVGHQIDPNMLAAYYHHLQSQGVHHDQIMQSINHQYQQHLASQHFYQHPQVVDHLTQNVY